MEIFDIVDENGIPTGETIERTRAHQIGSRHRTAHIWVVRNLDTTPEVLLQRRSYTKDSFPGRLDTSSAGHIQAGDEPTASAIRELQEELGITAVEDELKFIGTFTNQYEEVFYNEVFRDNEIAFVHVLEREIDPNELVLQEEELAGVEWHTIEETLDALHNHNKDYCIPLAGIELLNNWINKKES